MNTFNLYFVGYYKHGEVQGLVAGPFVTGDAASDWIFNAPAKDRLVICESKQSFEVVLP